jgi:hypothetical protein
VIRRAGVVGLCVIAALCSGCAYSIKDIDTSNREPACVRQCTATYSACVSQGPSVGFRTETLRACGEAYSVCANTCPSK